MLLFFFFQAEDGIRDIGVTGVQTCALPICLEDKERERLRKEVKGLDLGGGGAIIRTAAQGAKRADFERELMYLHKLHEVLQKRAEEAAAPAMVFQEADLSVRVVRDIFSADFERALVDEDRKSVV